VNEIAFNKGFNGVYIYPLEASQVLRSRLGNVPQLYPEQAPGADWLPRMTFGSTPTHAVNASLANSLPEGLPSTAYVFSDNLSKVWRSHQIKL
jgi:hypothetical protein